MCEYQLNWNRGTTTRHIIETEASALEDVVEKRLLMFTGTAFLSWNHIIFDVTSPQLMSASISSENKVIEGVHGESSTCSSSPLEGNLKGFWCDPSPRILSENQFADSTLGRCLATEMEAWDDFFLVDVAERFVDAPLEIVDLLGTLQREKY